MPNSKPNNYYEETESKVKSLIAKKDYEKAYELLKEELNMPYIPKKYEQLFSSLFMKVNHLRYDALRENYSIVSVDKVEKILNSPSVGSNLFEKIAILHQAKNINFRLLMPTVEKFLTDDNQDDVLKTILLKNLQDQEIDKELTIVKNKVSYKINPKNIPNLDNIQNIKVATKILESNLGMKFPNDFSLAVSFLNWFNYYIFPKQFETKDLNNVCAAIHYYVWHLQKLDVQVKDIANIYEADFNELKHWVNLIQNIKLA